MKICFLTYSIFNLGGIQRVVSVISSELANNNEVDILCTCDEYKINRNLYKLNDRINVNIDSSLVKKSFVASFVYRILKKINKETKLFNNNKMKKILELIYFPNKIQNNFIKYLNSKEYDVVIGVGGENSILLGIISDKLHSKTMGWQHNSYDAYLKTKGEYFWNQDTLFNEYIPKLDRYIVLTEYDKKMFLKYNNIKSDVIYNPKSFTSTSKSKLEKKQFMAAGRFTYQKGFDLLIESFREFADFNNEWNLIIIGDGEEKENIQKLINKYNLNDRIIMHSFTENIEKFFLESSALLLSSRWEGMPMIVLESLEMGVPIISYDITAIQPLIENRKEGIIVEKYNTKKFAEAMNEITESHKFREKLSKNAINKANKFTIDKIGMEWMEVLNNL